MRTCRWSSSIVRCNKILKIGKPVSLILSLFGCRLPDFSSWKPWRYIGSGASRDPGHSCLKSRFRTPRPGLLGTLLSTALCLVFSLPREREGGGIVLKIFRDFFHSHQHKGDRWWTTTIYKIIVVRKLSTETIMCDSTKMRVFHPILKWELGWVPEFWVS